MKCQSCGADYDNQALVCPYCGAENEVVAQREQQAVLKSYKDKMKHIEEDVSAEATKKANKKVTKLIVGIVILFFVVLAIVKVISLYMADTALERQEEYKKILEEYVQSGQYEKLEDILYGTNEISGATFKKYFRIMWTYQDIQYYVDDAKHCVESTIYEGEEQVEQYARALENIYSSLKQIQEMEDEGYPYGEGEIVSGFKEQFLDALRTDFQLTDEEIAEGMKIEKGRNEEHEPYMDMARMIIERLEAVK